MSAFKWRASCLALLCATSMGAAADDDSFEEHHAHEHGVATLDVAIDGPQLSLQFRTPAMNLLGFEHVPRTSKDQAAVTKAAQLLREPATQFAPSPAARCQVTQVNVTSPDWTRSAEHSEFEAAYEFRCGQPSALRRLEVRLFTALDHDVKLKAQVASAQAQRAVELTRSQPTLDLAAAAP